MVVIPEFTRTSFLSPAAEHPRSGAVAGDHSPGDLHPGFKTRRVAGTTYLRRTGGRVTFHNLIPGWYRVEVTHR